MRRFAGWVRHPQGSAVAREPLVIWREHAATPARRLPLAGSRPLEGLRVLDLTRVLAGPAATRFLAGFGADVLRIDPPGWEETAAVQEMTLGKRCARLNLGAVGDRATFETLLASADVLVHGYRSGALSALGYGDEQRRALNPGLTDVALNAYGWSGPWSDRRGFDSLVQMSSGIADFGMRQAAGDRPAPLPVQALDHATGYLVAAAILKALVLRREQGRVVSARLSLARTAHLLAGTRSDNLRGGLAPATLDDLDPGVEDTAWGPARRVRFPLKIDALAAHWPYPAGPLGASKPEWADAP
jgi:crotonobetainyl-CoA:carnitine CoA-transferase CaiB-like acyl-CoA transferase